MDWWWFDWSFACLQSSGCRRHHLYLSLVACYCTAATSVVACCLSPPPPVMSLVAAKSRTVWHSSPGLPSLSRKLAVNTSVVIVNYVINFVWCVCWLPVLGRIMKSASLRFTKCMALMFSWALAMERFVCATPVTLVRVCVSTVICCFSSVTHWNWVDSRLRSN